MPDMPDIPEKLRRTAWKGAIAQLEEPRNSTSQVAGSSPAGLATHRKHLGSQARKEARRRFKVRLWQEQSGKCWWCDCDIVLLALPAQAKKVPQNLATFDHLDDRFSPDRGKHQGTVRTVLACRKCNNERGRESQAAQPVEELRRRAEDGHTKLRRLA